MKFIFDIYLTSTQCWKPVKVLFCFTAHIHKYAIELSNDRTDPDICLTPIHPLTLPPNINNDTFGQYKQEYPIYRIAQGPDMTTFIQIHFRML